MNVEELTSLQKKRIELDVLESLVWKVERDLKEVGARWNSEVGDYVVDPDYEYTPEEIYKRSYLIAIKLLLEEKI